VALGAEAVDLPAFRAATRSLARMPPVIVRPRSTVTLSGSPSWWS